MAEGLQVITVILVAVAMALALAHALEMPGKLRLTREKYLVVQPIYYPSFTVGGAAEPLAIVATLAILVVTPPGSRGFWLTLVALLGLIGMQAVYWFVTHPVNKVWLKDQRLHGAGAEFFAADPARRSRPQSDADATDWTVLRNRWEYAHVVRAALTLVSLIALVVAIV